MTGIDVCLKESDESVDLSLGRQAPAGRTDVTSNVDVIAIVRETTITGRGSVIVVVGAISVVVTIVIEDAVDTVISVKVTVSAPSARVGRRTRIGVDTADEVAGRIVGVGSGDVGRRDVETKVLGHPAFAIYETRDGVVVVVASIFEGDTVASVSKTAGEVLHLTGLDLPLSIEINPAITFGDVGDFLEVGMQEHLEHIGCRYVYGAQEEIEQEEDGNEDDEEKNADVHFSF